MGKDRNFSLGDFGDLMSGASGLFGMFDNIFGFGRKRQMRDNKEMMRYSAGLGESQAQRDYRRTLDMFGRQAEFSQNMFGQEMDFNREMLANQQQYNSAEAQKQRLKDAGMSVGLMMGGGGAGASTSASTSAPSAPGGSPAPSSRPAPMSMSDKLYGALTLESMKTAIEGQKLENQSKEVDIKKDLAKADIAKTKADTENVLIENLWLGSKRLSEIAINQESANLNKIKNEEVRAQTAKLIAETILPEVQKNLAEFKMGKEFELTSKQINSLIERIESEAKKNNWQMGEFINWKNILESVAAIGGAVAKVM